MTMSKTYDLTDKQIRELANVFHTEQGNVAGVKACASHACNYLEKWKANVYKSPYEAVLYSGWWGSESLNRQRFAADVASSAEIKGCSEVIREGKRTLPEYCDEYDWLYDITSATNNGIAISVLDRHQYVKDVTVVKNRFGSTWTFYCFPDGADGICDPFGYISKPAGDTEANGLNTTNDSYEPIQNEDVVTPTYNTEYSLETVKLYSGSASTIILQSLLFAMGYTGVDGNPIKIDGSAGANTVYALCHFQSSVGLEPDGVCGSLTWEKLIGGLSY